MDEKQRPAHHRVLVTEVCKAERHNRELESKAMWEKYNKDKEKKKVIEASDGRKRKRDGADGRTEEHSQICEAKRYKADRWGNKKERFATLIHSLDGSFRSHPLQSGRKALLTDRKDKQDLVGEETERVINYRDGKHSRSSNVEGTEATTCYRDGRGSNSKRPRVIQGYSVPRSDESQSLNNKQEGEHKRERRWRSSNRHGEKERREVSAKRRPSLESEASSAKGGGGYGESRMKGRQSRPSYESSSNRSDAVRSSKGRERSREERCKHPDRNSNKRDMTTGSSHFHDKKQSPLNKWEKEIRKERKRKRKLVATRLTDAGSDVWRPDLYYTEVKQKVLNIVRDIKRKRDLLF